MTRRDIATDDGMSDVLHAWLDETAEALPDNPQLYAEVRQRVPSTRQRRHGWLPPLPDVRPRPTFGFARLAAVIAVVVLGATLVASWALTGPSLGPAAPVEGKIVVAADGSGDYMTIAAAVKAAEESDTILVRPGTYVESLVITKGITITGDGDRAAIVIGAPEDGPVSSTHGDEDPVDDDTLVYPVDEPYAFLLLDSDATLSGLTFRGERSQVHASGGSPTLEDLAFDGVGVVARSDSGAGGNAIVVNDGSTAAIRGNTLTGGGPIRVFDTSDLRIEDNTLTGGPYIKANVGSDAIIRANTIIGASLHGISFDQGVPGSPLIEGNTISDVDGTGISTGHGFGIGIKPIIRGNTISRTTTAIHLGGGSGESVIEENDIRDNTGGIFVLGGTPTVEGNTVTGGTTGLVLNGASTVPTLRGNTICDNETNLKLSAGAPMPATEGDEICPDAALEEGE